MTNSHNRTLQQQQQQQGGRHSDRNSPHNHHHHHQQQQQQSQSQHQQANNHQSTPHYHSNNNNHGQRKSHHQNGRQQQKSPSSASYFNSSNGTAMANGSAGSVSPFKYLAQTKNGNGYIVGRQTPPSATASSSPSIPIANGTSRMSPGGHSASSTPVCFASPAGVSSSPPNLHFASSKCFDAPSPDSLPRPPMHWTSQRANGLAAAVPSSATVAAPRAQPTAGPTPPRKTDTINGHTKGNNTSSSGGGKSSTSKRRLFNNDHATKASQKMGGRIGAAAHVIKAGGCMPTTNSASDIFSHNLKLLLNVQA